MNETTSDDLAPDRPGIVLDLGGAREGWAQRVADLELWCDRPLLPGARPAPRPALAAPAPAGDPGRLVYDGPGSIAGRIERVRAWIDPAGYRTVELARGERFRVSPGGELIESLGAGEAPPEPAGEARRLELAVGAPLALALALHGTVLLHAAALEREGGVLALLGASGAGKSTLAEAGRRLGGGWRRAADDILPVRWGERAEALPAFPQLKLPVAEGWEAAAPSRLPLAAVVEVERIEATPASTAVSLDRMTPAQGAAALVRATVAARLFDEALLRWHFERVTAAATRRPVWRLRFPSGRAGLTAALERLGRLVSEVARSAENP